MRSGTPKVLHRIAGRSLLGHAVEAARGARPERLVVVVRHQRQRVVEHLAQIAPDVLVADQDEIMGTGRAVECGLSVLPDGWGDGVGGVVLVTYADTPLLDAATLADVLARHTDSGRAVTVVTAEVADPTGYGRVVRDSDGQVAEIVEHKDASSAQRKIREINSGIYAFDASVLRAALARIGTDNAQGERYLTDVVALARAAGHQVGAHLVADPWLTEGVNDRAQLAAVGAELNRRICDRHMRAGVTIVDPGSTWLDAEVTIGQDTHLLPGTQLLGATSVGAGCRIGPEVTCQDVEVGDDATVMRCQATLAVVGAGAVVGPYVSLRPGATVAPGQATGPFIELGHDEDAAGPGPAGADHEPAKGLS